MVGWHHGFMDMSLNKLWETVKDRKPGMMQFVGPQSVGHDSATEHQSNWEPEAKRIPNTIKCAIMKPLSWKESIEMT